MSGELSAFDDAVGGVIEKFWGDASAAATAQLGAVWDAAAEQGWFELGAAGALDYAIAASRRLGRAACPLPLLDGYAATELLPDAGVASGQVRVVLTGDALSLVDCGGAATHVLLIPKAGGRAELKTIAHSAPMAGLAVPAWSSITVGATTVSVDIDSTQADRALVLTRLG